MLANNPLKDDTEREKVGIVFTLVSLVMCVLAWFGINGRLA